MSESTVHSCDVIDLLAGAAVPAEGRRVETLAKTDAFELKRLSLAKGAAIPEHHAPGAITVQCLVGRVAFTAGGTTHDLRAGSLIHLAPREPHALVGEEDSVVLVTKLAAPAGS
ncbi:cupin domain-containing protein [Paludisphaera mucosa]|uniref:Cupin domain-containing protein n=1 Tax=Paludisphaera mucosa TaxID=3030827 RepID=A0ABT6FKJ9_9BACT|nr:cupin domain-containing protein [Paludisphaera mucosa]MDG3008064.1 cupin domain-containing protein [Paludisphaera mucosa]